MEDRRIMWGSIIERGHWKRSVCFYKGETILTTILEKKEYLRASEEGWKLDVNFRSQIIVLRIVLVCICERVCKLSRFSAKHSWIQPAALRLAEVAKVSCGGVGTIGVTRKVSLTSTVQQQQIRIAANHTALDIIDQHQSAIEYSLRWKCSFCKPKGHDLTPTPGRAKKRTQDDGFRELLRKASRTPPLLPSIRSRTRRPPPLSTQIKRLQAIPETEFCKRNIGN